MAKGKRTGKGKNAAVKTRIIVIGIVAILIAAIIGIGFITSGFRQWNPKQWFVGKPSENADTQTGDGLVAVDNNGNEMQTGKVYTMPAGFTFVTTKTASGGKARASDIVTTENNSIIVRARITPENADDQRVTWESSDPSTVSVTVSDPDEPHFPAPPIGHIEQRESPRTLHRPGALPLFQAEGAWAAGRMAGRRNSTRASALSSSVPST